MRKLSGRETFAVIGLLILLVCLLPLEYDNFKFSTIIYPVVFICAAWVTISVLPEKNGVLKILLLIAGVVSYLISVAFTMLRFTLCAWGSYGVFYKNKNDPSLTIVCRTYECYGTAGDCEFYKDQKLTAHLKWVTKFTENPVDTTTWQNVRSGSR